MVKLCPDLLGLQVNEKVDEVTTALLLWFYFKSNLTAYVYT